MFLEVYRFSTSKKNNAMALGLFGSTSWVITLNIIHELPNWCAPIC